MDGDLDYVDKSICTIQNSLRPEPFENTEYTFNYEDCNNVQLFETVVTNGMNNKSSDESEELMDIPGKYPIILDNLEPEKTEVSTTAVDLNSKCNETDATCKFNAFTINKVDRKLDKIPRVILKRLKSYGKINLTTQGRLVWAFLQGWYPAIVIRGSDVGKVTHPEKVWVFWIGEGTISQLKDTNLRPFSHNFHLLDSFEKKKTHQKKHQILVYSELIEILKEYFPNLRMVTSTSAINWLKENLSQYLHIIDKIRFYPYPPSMQEVISRYTMNEDTHIQSEHPVIQKESAVKIDDKNIINGERPLKKMKNHINNIHNTKPTSEKVISPTIVEDNTEPISEQVCSPKIVKDKTTPTLKEASSPIIVEEIDFTETTPVRVFSAFDNISSAFLSLQNLKFKVEVYIASETDHASKAVSMKHHGDKMKRLGDLRGINEEIVQQLSPIDIFLGISTSMESSFEFFRVKNLIEKHNKCRKLYWLLENDFLMSDDNKFTISKVLKRLPIELNDCYFSAHIRRRLFWSNIPLDNLEIEEQRLQSCLETNFGRIANVDKIKRITQNVNSLIQVNGVMPVSFKNKPDLLFITEIESVFGMPKSYTDALNFEFEDRLRLVCRSWNVLTLNYFFKSLKSVFKSS